MSLPNLKKEITLKADKKRAIVSQRFFKTGVGEYGEGDIFIGITVPESRKIAKKYKDIVFKDIKKLLSSRIHEERFIALLILVDNFKSEKTVNKKRIFDFYLKNTKYVNNWDLVDLSAGKIVGEFILVEIKNKKEQLVILEKLAKSKNLWEKRISIIATFQFIKSNQFDHTLKISKILLSDDHDLIQKAVGWMLREVGKRSIETEEEFLKENLQKIKRTTLRYAIEKFPEEKRQKYLKSDI
ncbi:DNA alkylation repair protein [Patescibacteria group bacterium]